MQIELDKHGKADLIRMTGRLDSACSREAEERVFALLGESPQNDLLVDCTNLEYISSAGLRVLLKAGKHLHGTGCGLTLIGLRGPVARVFEMSGFDKLFPMLDALPGQEAPR
ncbi:MAG: STAS domain-containing protein [Opitutales bacterium]